MCKPSDKGCGGCNKDGKECGKKASEGLPVVERDLHFTFGQVQWFRPTSLSVRPTHNFRSLYYTFTYHLVLLIIYEIFTRNIFYQCDIIIVKAKTTQLIIIYWTPQGLFNVFNGLGRNEKVRVVVGNTGQGT